jgi:hypothetical protein
MIPALSNIPRAPLLLGLAGLLPFAWGAATVVSPALNDLSLATVGARFTGPYVQLFYGAIILSFMSGVLWGFAAKADTGRAAIGYALSVLPALWAFFMTGFGPTTASLNLMIGFAGLLVLDVSFARWGLTPTWWIPLRLLLSAIVLVCLGITAFV